MFFFYCNCMVVRNSIMLLIVLFSMCYVIVLWNYGVSKCVL